MTSEYYGPRSDHDRYLHPSMHPSNFRALRSIKTQNHASHAAMKEVRGVQCTPLVGGVIVSGNGGQWRQPWSPLYIW